MSKSFVERSGRRAFHRNMLVNAALNLSIRLSAVGAALIASGYALAASGDVVRLGTVTTPATFIEGKTGVSYRLFFEAIEMNNGAGDTTIGIGGGGMSGCSVHGPGVGDFVGTDFNYSGNAPFASIQCGTAHGQSVTINGCSAVVQAHGFVHADQPNVNYLGSTTIEVQFLKGKNGNRLQLSINGTQLSGTLTSGAISIATCP
jgi:hypothetical protein